LSNHSDNISFWCWIQHKKYPDVWTCMVLFTSIIFKKLLSFCLIIPTTFPFDAGSRVDNVRHTSGYFLCWIQHQKEILSEWLDKCVIDPGIFYRKLYNSGNCSTIWQNKTHFYTILTTNLYDKSQTKVPYGLVWYYLHR
jgi:hypothetical protein